MVFVLKFYYHIINIDQNDYMIILMILFVVFVTFNGNDGFDRLAIILLTKVVTKCSI